MKYYRDVILPDAESGKVVEYELQKPYVLQPKFTKDGKSVKPIVYVADFCVTYNDGSYAVIDTKGMPDSAAKLKRKMFWYVYPDLTYQWVGYSKIDGGWCDWEYINKQRKIRKLEKKKKQAQESTQQ